MTKLTAIGIETAQVKVRPERGDTPAQYMEVRGLSAEDFLNLFRGYAGPLAVVLDAVIEKKIDLDLSNVTALAGLLVDQVPGLVADAIVIANDDREDPQAAYEAAKRLPISVQLEAVEKIALLTFVDQTPGELLETVVRMMGGMQGLLKESGQALRNAVAMSREAKPN